VAPREEVEVTGLRNPPEAPAAIPTLLAGIHAAQSMGGSSHRRGTCAPQIRIHYTPYTLYHVPFSPQDSLIFHSGALSEEWKWPLKLASM
jgi:hypothetical protein